MLFYPTINATRCCAQRLCTECYLQLRPPRHSKEPCPFCKHRKVEVLFQGARSAAELDREEAAARQAAAAVACSRDCPAPLPGHAAAALAAGSHLQQQQPQQQPRLGHHPLPPLQAPLPLTVRPRGSSIPAGMVPPQFPPQSQRLQQAHGGKVFAEDDAFTDDADGARSTSATSIAERSTGNDTTLATVASSWCTSQPSSSPTPSLNRGTAASSSPIPSCQAPSATEYNEAHDLQTLFIVSARGYPAPPPAADIGQVIIQRFPGLNPLRTAYRTG
jgi:hypothetical protein